MNNIDCKTTQPAEIPELLLSINDIIYDLNQESDFLLEKTLILADYRAEQPPFSDSGEVRKEPENIVERLQDYKYRLQNIRNTIIQTKENLSRSIG